MPKSTVEWSHSDTEGFTPSHEGPCEVWCDDVRTFQDDDCAAHYTMVPAGMPFDRDACMGASTLTFYWMAMHSSSWQVYVNCAPLEKTTSTGTKSKYAVGSSTSSAQSNSTSSATSDTPSTSTTEAPTTPSTPSETIAPSPPSATTAPSTPSTTTAPTTDESDCGSFDVAGSGDATQDAGSQTNFDFSTMQGAADAGTVAPYK
ncbi:hypothetical protein PI124_g21302 [Phytophthora idaei]|nr:hypothetical protein PI125_g16392 [Phytophthora idaei]KAG3134326.1 hypothetical protein PI126_g18734 [Phytophthora idaei]KAG3233629.1 hypothetical protein PI124_g21302 [Phytophthora idaei]